METYERIRLLRKTLHLSQKEFGKPLYLTQNSISSIEKGVRSATPRMLDDICRCYRANPCWLQQGEGPMFLDLASALPETDDEIQQMAMQYLMLTEEQRKAVRQLLAAMLDKS